MDKCYETNNSALTVTRPCYRMELSKKCFDVAGDLSLYDISKRVLCDLMRRIIVQPKSSQPGVSPVPQLNEISAVSLLAQVWFDNFSMTSYYTSEIASFSLKDFDFLQFVRYHTFIRPRDREDWHSIVCIIQSLKEDAQYFDHWFKFQNGDKLQVVEHDDFPLKDHCFRSNYPNWPNMAGIDFMPLTHMELMANCDSKYYHVFAPASGPSREVGRVMRFDNGLTIKFYAKGSRTFVATIDQKLYNDLAPEREYDKMFSNKAQVQEEPDLSRLLLEQGIEPNPGPVRSYSPEEELEHKCKELAKLSLIHI